MAISASLGVIYCPPPFQRQDFSHQWSRFRSCILCDNCRLSWVKWNCRSRQESKCWLLPGMRSGWRLSFLGTRVKVNIELNLSVVNWSLDLCYCVGMGHLQDPDGALLRHGLPLGLLLFKLGTRTLLPVPWRGASLGWVVYGGSNLEALLAHPFKTLLV